MENKKTRGFTTIELIIVVAIIGILAAIAVPRFNGFRNMAEKTVCTTNRKAVEQLYDAYLLENEGLEANFDQFLIENFGDVCPSGGVISYENGHVKCSAHPGDGETEDPEDPPGEEVPWL